MDPKSELVTLLEERTRSHFDRRRQRLERIPWPACLSAIRKAWEGGKTSDGRETRLTREEWIVLHGGFVPEERDRFIQLLEFTGHYSRCRNCGRGVVADGPHSRCSACGSASGAGKPDVNGQKGETAR